MAIVMVPLDGSPFAEQALPLALAIARGLDARLEVVRVRASLPFTGDDESEAYVQSIASQLRGQQPAEVTPSVLTDELGALHYPPPAPDIVARVLADHARQHADLIVMSTHGRSGVKRAWLGSIADALLRIAPRPLLLVRPHDVQFSIAANADRGITHILIPLDGSANAEEAIPVARALATPFGARITLLRVTSPLALQMPADPAFAYPPMEVTAAGRSAAVHYLESIAAPLRDAGFSVRAAVIEELSPGPVIVDFATTHAADLVVLTTTGAGSLRRMLLGSVADHVIHTGDTPVLACNTRHLEPAALDAGASAAAGVDPEC